MILLDAEGPAFCAGYDLNWSPGAQADADQTGRLWDSAADQHVIGSYAATWAKLHDSSKPTIAAVSGWCIAGGTNIVFNAHLIVAGESARFGYPLSRVWGVPEAPWTWVARIGLQHARRYLLTGDEFTADEAKAMGVVLNVVPDTDLASHPMALAQRIAMVPASQLEMITGPSTPSPTTNMLPPPRDNPGPCSTGPAQPGGDGVCPPRATGWVSSGGPGA